MLTTTGFCARALTGGARVGAEGLAAAVPVGGPVAAVDVAEAVPEVGPVAAVGVAKAAGLVTGATGTEACAA